MRISNHPEPRAEQKKLKEDSDCDTSRNVVSLVNSSQKNDVSKNQISEYVDCDFDWTTAANNSKRYAY